MEQRLPLEFRRSPSHVEWTAAGLSILLGQSSYLVTPWPAFGIYYKDGKGNLRVVPEALRPVLRAMLDNLRRAENGAERLATYELARELPLWIHARLVPMRQYYWLGVETLAKIPDSRSVLEACPALFAAFAQCAEAGAFRGLPVSHLSAVLRGRERDLMREIGFGTSEATCKIFRKFSRYEFGLTQWRTLARNLRKPEVFHLLQHARTLPPSLLDFLAEVKHDQVFSRAALADIVMRTMAQGQGLASRFSIDSVLSFAPLFRRYGIAKAPFPSLSSFERLRTQAEDLLAGLPLGVGPVIALDGAAPIRSSSELTAEGKRMEHCVGSICYLLEGLKGNKCYYRVDAPECATICLRRPNGMSSWKLDEIAGMRNARISAPAFEVIRQALRAAEVRC